MIYYAIIPGEVWTSPDTPAIKGTLLRQTALQGGRAFFILYDEPDSPDGLDIDWYKAPKGADTRAADVVSAEVLSEGVLTPGEEAAEEIVKEVQEATEKGLDFGSGVVKALGVGLGLIFGIELFRLLRK
jgi:hypothetical protein